MDYHVSPNTIVGFALAGGGTNWGLANALGSGRSDALQAGAYGISYFGPAYVAGALAFTNHWFTTNRTALGDQLNANFDGQSYGARLEGGYRVGVLPTLGVTPYGAVQFQDFHTPAYSESDVSGTGFGLSYATMNATDVRTEIGSRFDAPTLLAGRPLILRGRVAWAHDFVSNPALRDAAGRELHGQWRADPARFRAHVGRRRAVPYAALDLARQIRRRIRPWLPDLRRLRRTALFVVAVLVIPGPHPLARPRNDKEGKGTDRSGCARPASPHCGFPRRRMAPRCPPWKIPNGSCRDAPGSLYRGRRRSGDCALAQFWAWL
jgi:hypothetical protein